MRTIIIAAAIIFGMISFPFAGSPFPSKSPGVITPIKIVNHSDYDSDIFVDGFNIGTFKATEEANLTMAFKELKVVLNNSDKTAFTIKPADIPDKCTLIVIRNKKLDYCPLDEK
jgi:hypothetical protein